MIAPEPTVRLTARVLLLDEQERVLLFRGESDADGSGFWFPAGGGLESGETAEQAAVREVFEETGRRIELGPEVWTDGTLSLGTERPSMFVSVGS